MKPAKPSDRYWVIIPAAGNGRRMQTSLPKQYLKINNITVLEHTLTIFEKPEISGLVLALSKDDAQWSELKTKLQNFKTPIYEVEGGQERCNSVFSAMEYLKNHATAQDWILVHDAARPCVKWSDITNLIAVLKEDPIGGLLASPVKDTIKQCNDSGGVAKTIDRSQLWRALTPQMFRYEVLHKALQKSLDEHNVITDDASAVEQLGLSPRLVTGGSDNIKITTPEDVELAQYYLSSL